MKIFGKEYRFLFSVEARFECSEIDESLPVDHRVIKSAVILSRAYEKRQKFIDKSYVANEPLTEEMLMMLSPGEFSELCDEIGASTKEGLKTTVEVAKGKKKVSK